ncbi:MAG: hypothetical protein FJ293_15640 [Planctomycetes bacterium]|nr:hypothetical protein [Planctomycetota bacterium]
MKHENARRRKSVLRAALRSAWWVIPSLVATAAMAGATRRADDGGEPAAGSDAARQRELALHGRWSAAFAGLPAELWRVFTDPAELTLPE